MITSTNALELSGETASDVSIYFYDGYVGGLGFSEKIYDLIPQVIEQAIRMVSGANAKTDVRHVWGIINWIAN